MRIGLTVANVVRTTVLGGFLGCLLALYGYGQNSASSSKQYVMDAKEARAWAAQLERRKVNAYEAVSAFEKSLYAGKVSDCERRLYQFPQLLSEGVRMSNCNELVHEKSRLAAARDKVKLRNQAVQLTDTGARVTVDVLSVNEHHIIDLKEVHEHWLVTSFTSTARQ